MSNGAPRPAAGTMPAVRSRRKAPAPPRYAPQRQPPGRARASPDVPDRVWRRKIPHPPVQSESRIAAMDRQVLQLHGPAAADARLQQRPVKRPVARQQLAPHEYLPDDSIDERRMHAVATEITRPRQPVAQLGHPARQPQSDGMSARFHRRLTFSACRPTAPSRKRSEGCNRPYWHRDRAPRPRNRARGL